MDGGMTGSGRESPPDVILTRCDEAVLLSCKQPMGPDMIIGLPFIVIGLSYGVVLFLQNFLRGSYWGAILAPGVGVGFAAIGYCMIAPFRLHIDVAARAYRYTFGWWPLRRVKEGRLEDFERLSVRLYSPAGRNATLFLHLRDGRRKPFPLHTANQEEVQRQGVAVASCLSLPLVDQSGKSV